MTRRKLSEKKYPQNRRRQEKKFLCHPVGFFYPPVGLAAQAEAAFAFAGQENHY